MMSSKVTTAALALLSLVGAACADDAVSPKQREVVSTVTSVFDAIKANDASKLHQLTCPGFYAFDGGKRLSGDEILALVAKYQASGTTISWSVTHPDVHIEGASAWIAYVDQGSMTTAAGSKPVSWLESAQLSRKGSGWCVAFLHSTPVAAD